MPENKWARLLAYVTGLVNQKLLLQNEYLAAENRILRAHLPARIRLSDPERSTLAEIASSRSTSRSRCYGTAVWTSHSSRTWSMTSPLLTTGTAFQVLRSSPMPFHRLALKTYPESDYAKKYGDGKLLPIR